MEIFSNIVGYITSLQTAVFVGLVMFVLCLVFKGGFNNAVRAGCCFAVGLTGVNLLISNCVTQMQSVAEGISTRLGVSLNIVDAGYTVVIDGGWHVITSIPALLIILVLNILFILIGWTKTMWTDIHNTWHGIFVGACFYIYTGNFTLALIVNVVTLLIMMKIADFTAPRFQEFNNTPGVAVYAPSASIAALFTMLVMKIIDRIPGLKDAKASAEDIQDKFGIFGEQAVLGMLIGIILGFFAGYDFKNAMACGVTLASVMALFPKMAAFICEGIVPVTTAIMSFMKKKFSGKDLYVAVDPAALLGDPSVMATFVLMVPIAIILCIAIPGIGFIPIASFAALPYIIGGIAPYARGNVIHTVICTTLYIILISFTATYMADVLTAYVADAGVLLEQINNGTLVTCWDEGGGILLFLARVIADLFNLGTF